MTYTSEISKTDLILLSLLEIKICTASQIQGCFYDSHSGVHAALNRLAKDNLIVHRTCGNNRESIYYLTQRGYLYIHEAYALHLPQIFKNSNPRSISSIGNKKANGYIQHTLAVGDIYYTFLKNFGFLGYTWNKREDRVYKRADHGEEEVPINIIKISDALVTVNTHTYLFEVDRALETRTVLSKKLNEYADYIFYEMSRPEWPDIIFSVLRLDESQRNQYPSNTKMVHLGEQIKQLTTKINALSRTSLTTNMYVSEEDRKLFSQKSEEELIRYRDALELISSDTISKKRNLKITLPDKVKGVGILIRDINTYLKSLGVEEDSMNHYNQLVKERNEKRKLLSDMREEISNSKRLAKEQSRKKQIIEVIEDLTHRVSREGRPFPVTFKDVILQGLNFYYVGTDDTPILIKKFSQFTTMSPCEQTAALFTMLMSSEIESRDITEHSIEQRTNFTIQTKIGDVSSPLAVDTKASRDGQKIRSVYMIDDISCGNLGGLLRVQRMCSNLNSNWVSEIDELKGVIIIDNDEQKSDLLSLINHEHNDSSQFIFIKLNRLAEIDMEEVTKENIQITMNKICEASY